MMDLKPISKDALPKALERAVQYRLLNEPWEAESICRDILNADPGNQQAIRTLILAITDKFESTDNAGTSELREFIPQLKDAYEQDYFSGIVAERLGKSVLKRTTPRVKFIAYEYLIEAMECYEKADAAQRDDLNEEAKLRWNACARMISEFKLEPAPRSNPVQPFLE